MSRANLDKSPQDVASMFDGVAARYDLVNDILSLGQTHRWRKLVVAGINAKPGEKVLDLAAGTGASSLPIAATGAQVVPCDFSLGMLRVGKKRHPQLGFTAGDALKLPFNDQVFDVVTISFGLRNVADMDLALSEMARVLKPGGRLLICEFSHPVFKPFRVIYTEYLMRALPWIARHTSSNPDAYVYLAESIRAWPDQAALAGRIERAGFANAAWRNLTGGIVALHRGVRT
ncbi:ubiquinone/menaquinone biosynthesis C-methyltransferase UbiE [mine drainage metagenome]|uniref:Ubiquinone/menaquinone biosynthesis C-methyltransferase UbiE n=1 Tax=mine drainage metagenome TaxID=410659 RepID=A0A1J5PT04_9ZZZZ